MIDRSAFELARRSDEGPAPLSFGQELLWLMDRASPGTIAWNVPRAFRLRGALDVPALQQALDALCARHEALRTVFASTPEGPRQIVLPARASRLQRLDLSGFPVEQRAVRSAQAVANEAQTPFDLARDVLLRALLVALEPNEWVLALTSHHIASDGWSKSVMFRELSVLYAGFRRGVAAELLPLPIQFADYAAWERHPLRQQSVAESLTYWTRQLAAPPPLELPVDRLRSRTAGLAGELRTRILPRTLADGVGRLAREHGVTPYMALLTAYVAILHRYTGQRDISIGSPIAARTESATEGLIGYLASTLVLRTRFEGEPSFPDLLALVRDVCLEAYEYSEVPFEQLAHELQKGRQLTNSPLFRVLLTMEDTLEAVLQFEGVAVEPIELERASVKADLTLLAAEHPAGLRLSLWYRSELYEGATAERLLGHLETLLSAVVADPGVAIGAVPLLGAAETAQLAAWNATALPVPAGALHEWFAATALRTPDVTAVVCGRERLSYGELDVRSRLLAERLRALGVERGVAVGLVFEGSCGFIVALLGTLRAGGSYVPLAPETPAARLEEQLVQSAARVVVAQAPYGVNLLRAGTRTVVDLDALRGGSSPNGALAAPPALPGNGVPIELPPSAVASDDVAYVLFTSGSSGRPKGVAVTHGNVANYTVALSARLELSGLSLQYAMVSSPATDLGNTAVFAALCSGGTLHMLGPEVARDPARFGEYVTAQQIDVLKLTPSHLRALLEGPSAAAVLPRRWLVLGGEACDWELVRRVRGAGSCRVLNHYGPTETTVGACTFEVTDERLAERCATVPIGVPLGNVRCYVLDERRQLVPVLVAGELYIGGAGVARGYVGSPEVSAESFVADPWSADGGRMYRTGDRVRRLATGELEFLGRSDGQVKVRGFRVELGDVESVLVRHAEVSQAAVVLRAAPGEAAQLAAYVVPAAGTAVPGEATLRAWLAQRVPGYMQPATFEIVERLPLTASGKLDRAGLAARVPAGAEAFAAAEFVAARTPTEAALAAIWAEVLHVERVSVTADFLALGFHSILAIRALGKLSRTLGVRLPLRSLFEAPTIERLARMVDAETVRHVESELEEALALVAGLTDEDVRLLTDCATSEVLQHEG